MGQRPTDMTKRPGSRHAHLGTVVERIYDVQQSECDEFPQPCSSLADAGARLTALAQHMPRNHRKDIVYVHVNGFSLRYMTKFLGYVCFTTL
jgi:hypothetical protein